VAKTSVAKKPAKKRPHTRAKGRARAKKNSAAKTFAVAAAPQPQDGTARIQLRLFDGTRMPVGGAQEYLVRLLDGNQQQLFVGDLEGPEQIFRVPFHDNLADRYTVLVSATHRADAGFFPVVVRQEVPSVLDLMLVPKPPAFDFSAADWDLVRAGWPAAFAALSFGTDANAARARYDELLQSPLRAAAFWNILTTMRDVELPQDRALSYLREIIWTAELGPTQDRFFAFADARLLKQMEIAQIQGAFEPEPHPGLFHKGATRSFKQKAFGEANLQLTFHEGTTKQVGAETWVRIEPDIDYFRDPAAHALLEVLPHHIGGGKTNPAAAYVLRWIAGRHAGVPEFNPPYTIVAPQRSGENT
jgi:hypothetical protein